MWVDFKLFKVFKKEVDDVGVDSESVVFVDECVCWVEVFVNFV